MPPKKQITKDVRVKVVKDHYRAKAAAKPKVDLKAKAKVTAKEAEVESQITDAILRELCPKSILARFKAAKTPAARADLLYALEHKELKELRDSFTQMKGFCDRLEGWFTQEFSDDQRGVTGKVGRVEIKSKEIAVVKDWPKFYKNIQKKGEFELLNKAVNQKAVQERWEANKQVPGIEKFTKKVVSLTAARGTK